MKQKNGGPTLDGSATKRSIFELPFIAPYLAVDSFREPVNLFMKTLGHIKQQSSCFQKLNGQYIWCLF